MGDRGKEGRKHRERPPDGGLTQRLGPKVRRALQGPPCLACGRPVDPRRQGAGHGYLHAPRCEEAARRPPADFVLLDDGREDLLLVRAAGGAGIES